MSARYLLDTNICIDIQRARRPEILARFQHLDAGEAMISVITYGELLAGAAKSKLRSRASEIIEEFTNHVEVLPLSKETAQIYGQIRASLELKGQVIGANDMWIAAHAKASNLVLVTNNEREFKRVPGLKIQNWIA
jgi:tRNA(fMet)-specific endonuclease VapC